MGRLTAQFESAKNDHSERIAWHSLSTRQSFTSVLMRVSVSKHSPLRNCFCIGETRFFFYAKGFSWWSSPNVLWSPSRINYYIRHYILKACGWHLSNRVISQSGEVWAHKTSSIRHFLWNSMCRARNFSGHVYVYKGGIDFTYISRTFLLEFGANNYNSRSVVYIYSHSGWVNVPTRVLMLMSVLYLFRADVFCSCWM